MRPSHLWIILHQTRNMLLFCFRRCQSGKLRAQLLNRGRWGIPGIKLLEGDFESIPSSVLLTLNPIFVYICGLSSLAWCLVQSRHTTLMSMEVCREPTGVVLPQVDKDRTGFFSHPKIPNSSSKEGTPGFFSLPAYKRELTSAPGRRSSLGPNVQ